MTRFEYELATRASKKELQSNWPDIERYPEPRSLKIFAVDNEWGDTIAKTKEWGQAIAMCPPGGQIRPVEMSDQDFEEENSARKDKFRWENMR